ncbi:Putative thaumatin domain family protein [Zea mays]|uniref:Putative thaumatin domain family protein n=1 Tax=Zea mays TaxID=4577 RepID=A0A1D6P1U7_MAIZE|nr:Putative thaumatin domain family protein [Zea mays]
MARAHLALVSFFAASIIGAASKSFTIANNCEHTVWPGILSSAGSAGVDTTGFALAPGESRALSVPSGWSGRLWGRTLCSTDAATGRFACVTGDCGCGRRWSSRSSEPRRRCDYSPVPRETCVAAMQI